MIRLAEEIPFVPNSIINYIKNDKKFKTLYELKVRQYTIEGHTVLVIKQFEKYFSNVDCVIKKSLFRILLSLHDIGKGKAFHDGDIGMQHTLSVEFINELAVSLDLSANQLQLITTVVSTDIIGLYFQAKIGKVQAVLKINELAASVNMLPSQYLRLMLIYYQVDAGSYTQDAGGMPFLERVFEYQEGKKVFDHERKLLKFSSVYENKLINIEQELK